MEFLPSKITHKRRLGGLVSMTTVCGVTGVYLYRLSNYGPRTLDACIVLPVNEDTPVLFPAAELYVPCNETFNPQGTFYAVTMDIL